MKIKGFLRQNKLIFAAFFLPVLIMAAAFAVTGIYPMGDNQIAVIDMYHQYVPFLSELQYKLQEGGSLFYTWNGAGGSNFWNLLAYYGASPLNLLLVLFPKKLIMEAVTVILLIKIGLAGSFMALYLRSTDKVNDWAVVGFASLYALSSYVMAYYWCIMWLDAVALLPLCIMGLNRLIDEGRAVLYTVSLAVTIFCNYYIAIMVCIFIFFYYPVVYLIKNRRCGFRTFAADAGKAAGFSLLAVAMSAVMLLPTFISMQNTYYISSEMPDNTVFYSDVLDVINQLLPYSELTYREGLPNLYCGMLTVILLVFYIMSRSISIREKFINGAFLLFMFFSLNINKLDFIWHGFHFPNQLPYRYTFVICFVLIGMAYKAFRRLEEIDLKTLWILLSAGTAYYIFAQKIMAESIDDMDLFFYGGMAWLALYCTLIVLYKRRMIKNGVFVMLTVAVIVSEMISSSCTSLNTVGNTQRETYFENYEDIMALADKSREEFVRTEMDANYILNCPALYHYRGISQFSSSINANATELMEAIGIEGDPGKNRYNYNQTNPVTNAILNVKYIITKSMPLDDPDFDFVAEEGNSRMYESRYPLSIGYVTGNQIRTWDTHSENPFEVLESYVKAATANQYENVFRYLKETSVSADNMTVSSDADGKVSAEQEDDAKGSKVILEYKADSTQKYYVFVEAGNAGEIAVKKGSEEKDEIGIRSDCGSIVNIGTVEEGESFEIVISYNAGYSGDITSYVCSLDYDVWNSAYEVISENMMQVTESGDTFINGTVDAGEGGMLVTSVPYEQGWHISVDGKEKNIEELAGGAFISVSIDEGTHDIELWFRPPGIIGGAVISCLAVALLVLYSIYHASLKREKTIMPSMRIPDHQAGMAAEKEESDCN